MLFHKAKVTKEETGGIRRLDAAAMRIELAFKPELETA
jgi:hypothetical protein